MLSHRGDNGNIPRTHLGVEREIAGVLVAVLVHVGVDEKLGDLGARLGRLGKVRQFLVEQLSKLKFSIYI